jgi:hypothetical protein
MKPLKTIGPAALASDLGWYDENEVPRYRVLE